ncbi:unnamed protein product [Oncorhynchus mykiss]|uniref:SWIM-type domain-containing protein n=1 Tax=Oncorhynchus mykiss TaxID=8022 RepID=A0A060WTK8_ONCMY|nr:unnamed protein product [Oncorhynchus mykiss]
MFAEWEDGERFSFEDSDRFEEDSLCSFISEAESLCQNWRGWRKQSAGPNSPTVKIKDGQVIPLVELSAKQVAFHIPFEVVEKVYPPVPEQLQLRIAYWSFPENEEDIRLYSCLANGSPDEFQRGEQLYRMRAVKDPLQIGFHLSATVVSPQAGQSKGAYNVAVMFDRCRITSCSCTCGAGAKWCAHVVALCLFRIHNASAVCLRAPVSESLSRLQRDQLQKFAQYLISELPQQILPTAQRLLDELLSSQSTAINTVCGAPDPTAGPSASDQSTWYLDESTLSDNIKKTLHKFCGPSPVVFSDVNSMYLSSTEPPAAAEWACLLRPLRGREPEGIWNLLSIVREMLKRRDSNAAPLLEILTEQCLTYEQIIGWWYSVRTSASHSSASGHTGRSNGQSEVAAHACASMCDEMVVLWRLAVLDPTMSPHRRNDRKRNKEQQCQFLAESSLCVCVFQLVAIMRIMVCVLVCYYYREARTTPQVPGQTVPGLQASRGVLLLQLGGGLPTARHHLLQCRQEERFLLLGQGRGSVSLSLEEGSSKGMYKGAGSSSSTGGKAKIAQGGKSSSGGSGVVGGKHQAAKRRTSSEDSSLEPDMAELSLDDGSSLALGAEASNTFDFTPPPPEMLPSPSPLLREPHKYSAGGKGAGNTPKEPAAKSPHDGRRETGTGAVALPNQAPEGAAGAGGDPVGEDDYQAYFLNSANEEGAERVSENNNEEEPDIFAGIKPLEQEGQMEVLFACAEALHAHGYSNDACRLAVELAGDLLANPPDLKVEQPQTKGKKSKVKLAYQESEVVALLKKIPLGLVEMTSIRDRAEQLRDGNFCDYRPVLPLMLASFIFDVLCTPVPLYLVCTVVSPTGSRPPSRNRNNEMPGDEELGFEAAVAALGMKTTVSEAEHPLLCEGTRREKGDLALALMITYKDDQSKLKKILDKLLDRESQTHKPQTLSSFYSSKPAASSQRSPSKHAAHTAHGHGGATGGVSKHAPNATAAAGSSSSSLQAVATGGAAGQQAGLAGSGVQNNPTAGECVSEAREQADGVQPASCDQPSEAVPFKPDGTVPSRLALGGRGAYSGRCWGSPVRQKKKHTGMASIDSSAPETTSDSSPTLSRRPLRGGWAAASWGRGQDSDSISSSSSDSLGSSSSSGSRRAGGGARAKSTDTSRYKGRRPECHAPHVPNQPSEAAAHFYFELAKTVLIKAGGNSSTSIFTQPSASGGHQGPHRNLHLCAFEIGLYALGLHNFVSPNWLSRTYSSHVSWITGQAMEIGSAALNILVECWDGHLTPPEVASLADRASRARDPNMVRAAAELALSCLPHAHALNPNEIQRALVQCKEQVHVRYSSVLQKTHRTTHDNVMLEKACMAVEEAAKGGGVYPEVLFEVAHQWYWLYEQTVGGGSGAQREGPGRCGANGGAGRRPPEMGHGVMDNIGNMDSSGVATVTASVTAAAVVPVISVGSTIYQSHALPGSAMAHPHTQGLHPYTTIQAHLPTVCTPQYLGHPLQHVPRPTVFPVSGGAYPQCVCVPSQGMHPAFIGAQYPFSVAAGPHPPMAATAVTFPGVPVPSMTQIAVHPYHTETGLPLSTTVAGAASFSPFYPVGGVHSGATIQAIQGSSLPGMSSQPVSLVSAPFPSEDEQHSQPISQQGLHYLHSAYRVGMLALEMLGRRAHNDHPNNFSRSPPYTEDVKWLLGLAARLGVNYVYQFCVGAAKGVLSPFVLQEIIMEALQRLNPAHIHAHLRTPAFHQLVQRCQQAYLQYIHHRLIHLTPADYDDFVNIIRSARGAFCLTPVGMMQFNDVLQNLKRGKQTKELWQRISLEMATFSP